MLFNGAKATLDNFNLVILKDMRDVFASFHIRLDRIAV